MGPVDYIVIAVIVMIVGAASYYIYSAKRSGRKCIGCPGGASCQECKCGCGSHQSTSCHQSSDNSEN